MKRQMVSIKIKREGLMIHIVSEIDMGKIDKIFKNLDNICCKFMQPGDLLDSIYFYEEEKI